MVNYFKTAAASGGDRPLPKVFWRKQWDYIELTVLPDLDADMRLADVFFALGWIWSFMAVPTSEFDSQHSGFKERIYVVLRREQGHIRAVGRIKLGFLNTRQTGSPTSEILHNATSVEPSSTIDIPPTAVSHVPWSYVFLVPESDIWLYFLGPRTALPNGADRVVSYLLLSILQQAWSVMVQNNGGTSFPPTSRTNSDLRLSVVIAPKTAGYRRQSLMTASMVADSAFGIVYYMLHEGFFGGRVSMRSPTPSKMRVALGDILINYPNDRVDDHVNSTAPAVATS